MKQLVLCTVLFVATVTFNSLTYSDQTVSDHKTLNTHDWAKSLHEEPNQLNTLTSSGSMGSESSVTYYRTPRITENHWQVAINNKLFHGKMEVRVGTLRADIATESQIVEVEKISKYTEGVQQALAYAKGTGKQPVLAVYIDGEPNSFEMLKQAESLCKARGIQFLLINSYVSTNDLMVLSLLGTSPGTTTTSTSGFSSVTSVSASSDSSAEYWLSTSSNVRHNAGCRYYKNTKNGRICARNEGKPCRVCGG